MKLKSDYAYNFLVHNKCSNKWQLIVIEIVPAVATETVVITVIALIGLVITVIRILVLVVVTVIVAATASKGDNIERTSYIADTLPSGSYRLYDLQQINRSGFPLTG